MAHSDQDRLALGKRLAAARKDAGYTIESAAKELTARGDPIGKQAVGAWEVGRNVPDALRLKDLARLYGCTTDALLTGEQRGLSWPFSHELYSLVIGLEPEDLSKVEDVMRAHLGARDMPRTEFDPLPAWVPEVDPVATPSPLDPSERERALRTLSRRTVRRIPAADDQAADTTKRRR